MARRKRLRNNPRDEWEFDLLEEDEAEALAGNPEMAMKMKKGGKRRAGELYDAFAAGSDDEDDDEEYRDRDGREKRVYGDNGSVGSGSGSGSGNGSGHHVIGDDEESSDEESVVDVKDEKKLLRK